MFDVTKLSSGMRILLFLAILLISSLIGVALMPIFSDKGSIGLTLAQGIGSIMMFVVPPIVYFCLTRKEKPMMQLGWRKASYPILLVGVAVMFISLPVTNQLTQWNEEMHFGKALAGLEHLLKSMEEAAAETTRQMLSVSTIGELLLNLLVIALIPAVGEELTFRGVLQQALTRHMKSPHAAVILSAAIFSFIHFQFYGFLPRMFLGILLGYMFYISGSLWTSVAMHFVNNGTAVVLYYLDYKGLIDVDVEHFGTMSGWMVAVSAIVTVALIASSYRRQKPPRDDEKQISIDEMK